MIETPRLKFFVIFLQTTLISVVTLFCFIYPRTNKDMIRIIRSLLQLSIFPCPMQRSRWDLYLEQTTLYVNAHVNSFWKPGDRYSGIFQAIDSFILFTHNIPSVIIYGHHNFCCCSCLFIVFQITSIAESFVGSSPSFKL